MPKNLLVLLLLIYKVLCLNNILELKEKSVLVFTNIKSITTYKKVR